VESTYLNRDMCKFESSQKDESRWQSTDSSKAYRNTSAFKCCCYSVESLAEISFCKREVKKPLVSQWCKTERFVARNYFDI